MTISWHGSCFALHRSTNMSAKQTVRQDTENAIQAYFQKIRHKPLLDTDSEKELSKRILAGDNDARQVLVESNLKLVVKIAKALGVSLDDLMK